MILAYIMSRNIAGQLSKAVHFTERIAKGDLSGFEESSGRAQNISVTAEEMSTNMQAVASASDQTSSNVQLMATAIEQMTATISEVVGNTINGRTIVSIEYT